MTQQTQWTFASADFCYGFATGKLV